MYHPRQAQQRIVDKSKGETGRVKTREIGSFVLFIWFIWFNQTRETSPAR
jgi:hypothetical protein